MVTLISRKGVSMLNWAVTFFIFYIFAFWAFYLKFFNFA